MGISWAAVVASYTPVMLFHCRLISVAAMTTEAAASRNRVCSRCKLTLRVSLWVEDVRDRQKHTCHVHIFPRLRVCLYAGNTNVRLVLGARREPYLIPFFFALRTFFLIHRGLPTIPVTSSMWTMHESSSRIMSTMLKAMNSEFRNSTAAKKKPYSGQAGALSGGGAVLMPVIQNHSWKHVAATSMTKLSRHHMRPGAARGQRDGSQKGLQPEASLHRYSGT